MPSPALPRYTAAVIRNIIFDWSGTLADDLPAVWHASNHVLTQAGKPEITLDQFRQDFRLPFTLFYDLHTPHIKLPQLEEWFHGRFRQVQDSVVELPHARKFLEFCREKKIRTFLLSTVASEHWAVQSKQTNLGHFIDTPYIGIVDKREKIHAILTDNNLIADETMFIGDMEHDIETAKHGGVHSCAVLTGYNTLSQLRHAHPDLICEHLGELKEILQRNDMELRDPDAPNPMPIATVGALIFDAAGEKVLLVRTHKWSGLWGIPGGKIKWAEPSETALRRELKEETNLEVADIKFVLVQDSIHSKEFYRDAHFVLLNYTCRVTGAMNVKLNDEAREFRWLTLTEAATLPLNQPTRVLLESVAAKQP